MDDVGKGAKTMSWKKSPVFYLSPASNKEREELKRLCYERDRKIKPEEWPTIITDQEMQARVRLGMNCSGYITLTKFRKRAMLENKNFIHNKKTLQQEIDDKKFFEKIEKSRTHIDNNGQGF